MSADSISADKGGGIVRGFGRAACGQQEKSREKQEEMHQAHALNRITTGLGIGIKTKRAPPGVFDRSRGVEPAGLARSPAPYKITKSPTCKIFPASDSGILVFVVRR